MSDCQMEFNDLGIEFGLDPLAPLPREDVIFEPLGLSNAETFAGTPKNVNGSCQTQFSGLGFGIDSFVLLPPPEADLVEPQNAWNEYFAASSMSTDVMSLSNNLMPSHVFLSSFNAMPFNPTFGMNEDLHVSRLPSATSNNFAYDVRPETDMYGFTGSSDDPFFNGSQAPPSFWPSYPPSVLGTPALYLSPSSSTQSVSPTSTEEYFPSASILAPQPSLAGPTVTARATPERDYTHSGLFSPVASENEFPVLPNGQAFAANTSTANTNSSISCSPSASPVSSPPAPHASPATPSRQNDPLRKKTRSSTAKATHSYSRYSFSAQSSKVPCTVRGCTGKFFDKRTRDRHVVSIHERAPDKGHLCPGMCRKGGFSREDALNRHLLSREESSVCKIEARKLGWSPNIKTSVQLLRDFTPRN